MILSAALRNAERKLAEAAFDSPALDARLLFEHALKMDRSGLLSQADRALSDTELQNIETAIARRLLHEPVARIIGEREFWSLPFGLNEATLEPRPDSETLVEVAIGLFPSPWGGARGGVRRGRFNSNFASSGKFSQPTPPLTPPQGEGDADIRILDLGTGTGCLLLSLLHELPTATGLGIDIAPRAVEQAKLNAEHLGLAPRVAFQQGNWLEGISEKFDAIISNPPYIPAGEIPVLMPEVREHDPLLALDGGDDGLNVYRHLIPQLGQFLKPQGFVIFEVGMGQANGVAELCHTSGFAGVTKHQDFGGVERCVVATYAKL